MPKGFGYGPETNKQERENLLDINPIAKHASGGSWMSKHSKSAFQMGYSPAEMTSDDEKKSKFRKDIDEKRDLVDNPFYGDNKYQGFTLDKSARESKQIPRSVVENIYKRVHERDKKNPVQMNYDSPAKKEGEKPSVSSSKLKTTEQLAAESRARGKQNAMKAQAKKDKESGAHTGRMVTVMTSMGPKQVDSRSQAARDLPRAY